MRERKSRILGPQEPREAVSRKIMGTECRREHQRTEQEKALDLTGDILSQSEGGRRDCQPANG